MSSMLNGIGTIASSLYGSTSTVGSQTNPSKTISQVFTSLDTQGKGYLEAADFQAAFESLGLLSGEDGDEDLTVSDAEEVFSVLDGDGDGKVTSEDMTLSLGALTGALGMLRGWAGADESADGGAPPAPPHGVGESGFTREELSAQLESITAAGGSGASDSRGTDLLTGILGDFDSADANGDGRIDGGEAASFAASLEETQAQTTATAGAAESEPSDLLVMRRIMELMEAYGVQDTTDETSEPLSLIA